MVALAFSHCAMQTDCTYLYKRPLRRKATSLLVAIPCEGIHTVPCRQIVLTSTNGSVKAFTHSPQHGTFVGVLLSHKCAHLMRPVAEEGHLFGVVPLQRAVLGQWIPACVQTSFVGQFFNGHAMNLLTHIHQ